ncbi:PAS domain-containing protein [Cereibacter johrii]|uniref:PAS domain-containing protein n=1 Tax=Cereibacter johrii TaxID=445629 RepID=UPI002B260D99|nr:PAS domain-containing protein [Cereibacter johrii]MEA5162066.1 PAS domain-containing protein [Cereibacter johrii]
MGMRMGGTGVGQTGSGRTGVDPASLALLRSYWHELRLRAGGELPRRGDIDPRRVEEALTCAFLAERIAPGMARFRLAGMHLADLMGIDVRGVPISTLFDVDSRERLASIVARVLTGPGVGEIWLESPASLGRAALTGRLLLLPLRPEESQPLIFGCLVTDGAIGRAPRRLTILRSAVDMIDAQPAERPGPRLRLPDFGAAGLEPPPPPPRAAPGRKHLRLVKG